MTMQEFYAAIDGNFQEALGRLMKDAMILRFVRKFPLDPSYAGLAAALDAGDTDTAFRQAHTLKGVCANLAFTSLADSAAEITEMLRAGDLDRAGEFFPTLRADYEKVIDGIGKLS